MAARARRAAPLRAAGTRGLRAGGRRKRGRRSRGGKLLHGGRAAAAPRQRWRRRRAARRGTSRGWLAPAAGGWGAFASSTREKNRRGKSVSAGRTAGNKQVVYSPSDVQTPGGVRFRKERDSARQKHSQVPHSLVARRLTTPLTSCCSRTCRCSTRAAREVRGSHEINTFFSRRTLPQQRNTPGATSPPRRARSCTTCSTRARST